MLLPSVGHHVGSLTAAGRVKLFAKGKSGREWHTINILVPSLIIIELISEFGDRRLEIVGHDTMELLLHFVTEHKIIQARPLHVRIFKVLQGCRYPTELIDDVVVHLHNLLQELEWQSLARIFSPHDKVACTLLQLLLAADVDLHATRNAQEKQETQRK